MGLIFAKAVINDKAKGEPAKLKAAKARGIAVVSGERGSPGIRIGRVTWALIGSSMGPFEPPSL